MWAGRDEDHGEGPVKPGTDKSTKTVVLISRDSGWLLHEGLKLWSCLEAPETNSWLLVIFNVKKTQGHPESSSCL